MAASSFSDSSLTHQHTSTVLDSDESLPSLRPCLTDSPVSTSSIQQDCFKCLQSPQSEIDVQFRTGSVDVESLGLSQTLFDDWLRVNDKLLQEDEHPCGIEELLCLYVETLDGNSDISDRFQPRYYEQIAGVFSDGNMNSHGVSLKQILYEAIHDCMLSIPSFTPLQTKLNHWTHQEYPTYGGDCRPIDILLLDTHPWEASRNPNIQSISGNRTGAEDFYVFYHGCSEEASLSIVRNGIGLHWSNQKGTDFGPGLYVTKKLLDAMYVAQRRSASRYMPPNGQAIGNRSCCIIFHCPTTEYDLFRKLDLSLASFDPSIQREPLDSRSMAESDMLHWHNFVHLCHNQEYPLPLVRSYDSIQGPVCCNIRQVQTRTQYPLAKSDSFQSCIRSVRLAEKMTEWIRGLIVLEKTPTG